MKGKERINEARGFVNYLRKIRPKRKSRIKRQFKKAISDPSHNMCRDRLMREFKDLI